MSRHGASPIPASHAPQGVGPAIGAFERSGDPSEFDRDSRSADRIGHAGSGRVRPDSRRLAKWCHKIEICCIYAVDLASLLQRNPFGDADRRAMPDVSTRSATPSRPEREPARWRAARLLDAPHRLCFFWAGVQWAVAATWWAAHLFAASRGWAWAWRVPAASAHGLWFGLGAMPLFIAGFMMTAGPQWLRRPPVAARSLRLPVGLFTLGWAIAVAGFHLGSATAAAGLSLVTVGWGALTWRIARLVAGSAQADRRHPWLVACACTVIVACLGVSSLVLALGRPDLLRPVTRVALWGGVAAVFLVVSHRMLPFLGAGAWPALDARWPDWPLWMVVSVPVLQSAGAVLAPWEASLPGWRGLQAAYLAVVATLCLWIAMRWLRTPALRQPLVAMLFGAFLWWDAALWLAAVAHGADPGTATATAFDLAALHALTMGYLGSTLLVMATRVSSTRSGRPQAIDRVARALYVVLQGAVVMRLAAALGPASAAPYLPWAGLAWLGVALSWALRHGRWLGSPRLDGRPG